MPVAGLVRRNTYRDSVALMALSARVADADGVKQASVVMGTPANLEILAATGLLAPELAGAGSNDLLIAVEAGGEAELEAALATAKALLASSGTRRSTGFAAAAPPRTLASAARARPDANIALISVPGEHAMVEASAALTRGMHVFLFSDNVPLADEIAMKRFGAERGLLVMGPDCGTALVAGAPLGFANAVRRGRIGIVASSGTGLQEVSSQIDRLGGGVSHALGTGSRDLSAAVGGVSFLMALEALTFDSRTDVLVLIAKPGAPEVQEAIYRRLAGVAKPVVLFFLGAAASVPDGLRVSLAENLMHAAQCAVALGRGATVPPSEPLAREADALATRLLDGVGPAQRRVVGLYTGGTLGQEAAGAIGAAVGRRHDAPPGTEAGSLLDLDGHLVLDLGDDAYTRGRPHPMIDPRVRNERLVQEAARGDVALFVLDVVLGYGAHPDPAAAIQPALALARTASETAGATLRVLVSVTGTNDDHQDLAKQTLALENLGVVVAPSSSVAALAAGVVALRLGGQKR